MGHSGHFKPGYDPNRNLGGRPKGSKDIRSAITLKMIRDHTPIVEQVLMDVAQKALAGVEEWQKWYLDRMIPPLYGKPKTEIEIVDATNLEEVVDQIKGTLPKSANEEILNIIKNAEKVKDEG